MLSKAALAFTLGGFSKTTLVSIVSPRGDVVHATSLHTPERTACGKITRGWAIATNHLNCIDCKAAVFYKVKRP